MHTHTRTRTHTRTCTQASTPEPVVIRVRHAAPNQSTQRANRRDTPTTGKATRVPWGMNTVCNSARGAFGVCGGRGRGSYRRFHGVMNRADEGGADSAEPVVVGDAQDAVAHLMGGNFAPRANDLSSNGHHTPHHQHATHTPPACDTPPAAAARVGRAATTRK